MRTALIPPNQHLDEFGTGELHLLLAHLFKKRGYLAHYRLQRERGAYLIVDNSAHEYKEGIDAGDLARLSSSVNAQEVVVPDVLDNGPATVERALDALETWFEKSDTTMRELNPALMYVPQGIRREEYYECLTELIGLHTFMAKKKGLRRDFVLGVSKDYEDFPGGLMEILRYLNPVREALWVDKEIRMHVHILGWSRNLWVLDEIAKEHTWIRSTDSAKPFVYAMANIPLSPPEIPPYPGRHATGYFAKRMTEHQRSIARTNCEIFSRAARGEL